MGFFNYSGYDIELSIASNKKKWAYPEFFEAIFDYVFNIAKCDRCTARIEANNKRAIKLVEKLGFTKEGTARKALKGEDVHIYGMLKDECRWINE